MKKVMYSLFILVILFVAVLPNYKCFAKEKMRFHSDDNDYSITIPEGWVQIPKHIILDHFSTLVPPEISKKIRYEVAFQHGEAKTWFQYPYAVIQVMAFSDLGINRQINADEFSEFAKRLSNLDTVDITNNFNIEAQKTISDIDRGKAYIDRKKMSYMIGLEANVTNIGKVKGVMIGHVGKRAIIQMTFYDLKYNWILSKRERDLILNSFQFNPSAAYSKTTESSLGFFERRAMEVLPIIVLVSIVAGIGAIWGYLSGKIKNYKDEKTIESSNF